MSLEDLRQKRPPAVSLPPADAVIATVTDDGVFATPLGMPASETVGPCRGPRTINGTAIAPGMHVLLVFTSTGPWIVSVDE